MSVEREKKQLPTNCTRTRNSMQSKEESQLIMKKKPIDRIDRWTSKEGTITRVTNQWTAVYRVALQQMRFHSLSLTLAHSLSLSPRRQLASNLLHLSEQISLSCPILWLSVKSLHREKNCNSFEERNRERKKERKREATAKRDQIKTQAIRQNEESRKKRKKLERGLQWATVKW